MFAHISDEIIRCSPNAIVVTDPKGKIILVNPEFIRVTGYSFEEVRGQTMRVLQSGRHELDFYEKMWAKIQETGRWSGEIWNRHKEGALYVEWLTVVKIEHCDQESLGYIGYFNDITKTKALEEMLREQADLDPLTGLMNRIAFQRHLDALGDTDTGGHYAVLFLDLDGFKQVNDVFGHHEGDRLLGRVASCLTQSIRSGDLACRIGGDEFVVLLPSIQTMHEVEQIATKILHQLNWGFEVGRLKRNISVSIGISTAPDDSVKPDMMLRFADMAMYEAKRSGGNTYKFYVAPNTDTKNDDSRSHAQQSSVTLCPEGP